MTSMIDHQIRRREELRINPRDAARPVPTGGKGSRGSSGHLNLDKPLPPAPTGTKKMRQYRARVAVLAARRSKRKAVVAKRKPIGEHVMALILRRERALAYIRELASLARTPHEIAALLHVSETTVYKRMRQGGIDITRRRESPLRQMVRQWYGIKSPSEIAEMVGTTRKTVGVVAYNLGLTLKRHDTSRFRRGFVVPDDRWNEYIALRREFKASMTAKETGMMMGLIPRPPLEPRPASRYSRTDQEARP